MSLFIGLLTALLVIDCLLLILLVLVQLPKKEAGAGLAFGSGAADALFGAGAGNPLTKITKFAAITFFALLIVISLLQKSAHGVEAETKAVPTQAAPATAPAPAPAVTPAATAVTNAVTK